jgi:predicted nucleotidyltransferase
VLFLGFVELFWCNARFARGDFDDESDIDIMVLADVPEDEIWSIEKKLNRISGAIGIDNDIFICIMLNDKTLFEQRMPILPFYQNVINDGVQIYAN